MTIEGSNDGTNFETLSDSTGAPLTFTESGIKLITENTLFIRPDPGGASSVTVIIISASD